MDKEAIKAIKRAHWKKNRKWLTLSLAVVAGAMIFMDVAGVEKNTVANIGIGAMAFNLFLYYWAQRSKIGLAKARYEIK